MTEGRKIDWAALGLDVRTTEPFYFDKLVASTRRKGLIPQDGEGKVKLVQQLAFRAIKISRRFERRVSDVIGPPTYTVSPLLESRTRVLLQE